MKAKIMGFVFVCWSLLTLDPQEIGSNYEKKEPLLEMLSASFPLHTVVYESPPSGIAEHPGQIPGPDFVWVSGFWSWSGHEWIWNKGHWMARPHESAIWIDGRWEHHNDHWHWIRGCWR